MPKETARDALSNDWFERAMRVGHAAKGAVFGVIGVLAARLALRDRSEIPDFAGALEKLSEQPLDFLFLCTLALGLLAYAAWRFASGLADWENNGNSLSGWSHRAIMFGVGFTYLGFAIYAIALLLGVRRGDPGLEGETAQVMAWPYGEYLVGVIGAGVAIAGLYELFVAFTARYKEEFSHARLAGWERGLVHFTGWWGHAARGVIYCAAGFFAVKSAVTYDPDEARGFSDTLWELGTGPYGDAILLFIAAGLIAFGAYSLLLAIHRHIPDEGDGTPEDRLP